MKKYVYNLFRGGYDTPVFMGEIILPSFIGYCRLCLKCRSLPSVSFVFVKEVEVNEP